MNLVFDPPNTYNILDRETGIAFKRFKPQPFMPSGVHLFTLALKDIKFINSFKVKTVFSPDEKFVDIISDIEVLKKAYDSQYTEKCKQNNATAVSFDEYLSFIKAAIHLYFSNDFKMIWNPDPPPLITVSFGKNIDFNE